MPHALARALEQPGRIVERRPVEEADIHMSTERIDIAERRIFHAGNGVAVIQNLANVRSAATHHIKPWQRKSPQFVIGLAKPRLDGRISPDGARKAHECVGVFWAQQVHAYLRRNRVHAAGAEHIADEFRAEENPQRTVADVKAAGIGAERRHDHP